jgi:hypothetical protein
MARSFVDSTGTLFHFAQQSPPVAQRPIHTPRPMLAGNVIGPHNSIAPVVSTALNTHVPANHLGNGSYA